MKKNINAPVAIAIVMVLVLVGGFFGYRALGSTQEFAPPDPKLAQPMPDWVKNQLKPEQRAALEKGR